MIRIVDNTLMAPYGFSQSKAAVYRLCELLFIIGVDVIEIPVAVYEAMDAVPPGKYYLNVNSEEEVWKYRDFSRYICRHEIKPDFTILDIQVNDIREIHHLKNYQNQKEVRITGLDDLLCHSYEKLMHEMISSLPNTMILFNPENTYHCASALALQWLLDFGSNVTTSFAGCMNNAATEEVIMALRLAVRYKPNKDLTVLPELTKLFEQISGVQIGKRKAIIGKNIFQVEAGIHVDALHKNPVTYEAYSPSSVGGISEVIIGKHSGMKSIKLKMSQLDLEFPGDETVERILDRVRKYCTVSRKSLNDEEFIGLVMEVMAGEGDKTYC